MTIPPASPFSLAQALAQGLTRAEIDRRLETGELVRLRHGWYAEPTKDDPRTGWEGCVDQHLARLTCALASRPGHSASHTSAGLLHDLAVTVAGSTPVHLTTIERVPASRRYEGLRIHRSESVENHTELVGGVRATTVVRTAADILRTRTLPHGVAMLDDALRRGKLDLEDLRAMVNRQVRWGGRPRALAAIHLADPSRESWGESFSFVHLHLLGHPLPIAQVEVYDANGTFLARLDGLWPETGVVGECDGDMKYFLPDELATASLTPEQTVLRRLEQEAVRQRRVEATGLPFVRWSPTQMRDNPRAVSERLNAAAATARPEEFTGWVRWGGDLRKLPFTVERPAVHPETLRYRRARRRADYR